MLFVECVVCSGQKGDVGVLRWTDEVRGVEHSAVVVATERPYKNGIAMLIDVRDQPGNAAENEGTLTTNANLSSLRDGLTVRARVDQNHRNACSVHHSATHLLNASLRELLGPQVEYQQANKIMCGLKYR